MNDPVSLYQKRLNLEKASFSRIEHEDASVAVVYKIIQSDGKELILKICTRSNDYLREVYFLSRLAGQMPIPKIIRLVEPEKGIHGAILMECLPGGLLTPANLDHSLAYEIGAQLAWLHCNTANGYGDLIQSEGLNSDPRIPFTLKFEEGFSECNRHLPKTLLQQCHAYFEAHIKLLQSVDGPCLIHRDFRPGNLLVHKGKLQGIIDWASGRGGFAEEDFCPIEHGEWQLPTETKKSLLIGYTSIRPIPNYTAIMPLLRMNRAFATMGFMIKNHTWESTHARVYQFNLRFLETVPHLLCE